jgi:hypothetical protein
MFVFWSGEQEENAVGEVGGKDDHVNKQCLRIGNVREKSSMKI